MKHAEKLGERIVYLGGTPTKKPSPLVEGGDLKKIIEDDLAKENGAIKQYKEHIKLANEKGDPTTRLMLEKILSEEEGHADTWETTLGIRKNNCYSTPIPKVLTTAFSISNNRNSALSHHFQ